MPASTAARTIAREGTLWAAFVLVFVALDWISLIEPFGALGIAPWNPAAGFAFAFLLKRGPGFAPAVAIAVMVADMLLRKLAAAPIASVLAAMAVAGGYGFAAKMLRARIGQALRLEVSGEVFALLAVALGASLLVSLFIGGLYVSADMVPIAALFDTVLHHWVGDIIGIAVVTPFLLLAFQAWPPPPLPRRLLIEYGIQFAAICGGLWVIFGLEPIDHLEYSWVLFLPLVWIALRDGLMGATWGVAATQIGVIIASQIKNLDGATITQFQILMLAVAATGLFLGIAVDERRRAETRLKAHDAELAQAMRLAATGEMAGALAHELNQPLTSLIGFARACQATLDASGDDPAGRAAARGLIDQAVQQALRAGDIIRTTREFLRQGEARMGHAKVSELLAAAVELMRARAARHQVAITVTCPPNLPGVLADALQIEQVVVNLIRNGIDALVGRIVPGGAIAISARLAPDDPNLIEIAVRDNGPGIAAEVADRLFTPYASTKEAGMGLGLAISRSIVEAHGGHIRALSAEGRGTDMRFTLPVYADVA
ncbi:MAG: two-component sensor histidine kinase [Alphaproteobacteria bacterium]|nr:two-component sensor histidine kinase [Alphaproteobacteria bacterium]